MGQHTLHAPVSALTDIDRPTGIEITTLTRHDIPVLVVLTLDAYGDPAAAETLLKASEEPGLTFDDAFGPVTEDSFVGAWGDGALVGTILVVRESPWDDAPDGLFVANLVIGLEYRRRGIVMALIVGVASHRKDWGFDSLALRIDSRHSGAAELYGDLGFEEID